MALFNPAVPAKLPITQLKTNDIIYIKGVAPASGVFAINLETGNDVVFHFVARFNEHVVACNTRIGDNWGPEEQHGAFPFRESQPFEIVVLVQDAQYKVAVNGAQYIEYKHRVPKENVREVVVSCDVQLHVVIYLPNNPFGYVPTPAIPSTSFFQPQLPYTSPIAGGLTPGKMIRIIGVAVGKRFTVNLLSGAEKGANIGLHFDVRFDACGDRNVVVRNSFINGAWGKEERQGPAFPFSQNTQFEIIILVESSCFKVAVNNASYTEYAHRIPLSNINHLNINGEAQIHMVLFQ